MDLARMAGREWWYNDRERDWRSDDFSLEWNGGESGWSLFHRGEFVGIVDTPYDLELVIRNHLRQN